MYKANVFNVMIASPGDVQEERDVAKRLIIEWNDQHSSARKIVLLPLGWEYSSSPSSGGSGQEILNKQLLERADLIIGIFGSRVGTPTKAYSSGTVEEINKHIDANKKAMLYFSNKPIPRNKINHEELAALDKVRKEFEEYNLYDVFESTLQFEEKFRKHLTMVAHELEGLDQQKANVIPPPKGKDTYLITNNARELLMVAGKDDSTNITKLGYPGSESIIAGGKDFTGNKDSRSVALWMEAFEELLENGLIKDNGGNIFPITNKGFNILEKIGNDR